MFTNILGAVSRIFNIAQESRSGIDSSNGYELYRYCKADGSFDYEKYRKTQIEGNRRKIEKVWATEKNISFLANYVRSTIGNVQFGICHGTRRGMEQAWFRKYLNCNVIGTEISPTAKQFPHTIEWDFHHVKPEWLGRVDFIYSNSMDHSYDPEKCLTAWMSCIREGGICILEHTSGHESATRLDPFGAHISILPYLILNWGSGKFCVREILEGPSKSSALEYLRFIVIQRC